MLMQNDIRDLGHFLKIGDLPFSNESTSTEKKISTTDWSIQKKLRRLYSHAKRFHMARESGDSSIIAHKQNLIESPFIACNLNKISSQNLSEILKTEVLLFKSVPMSF